MEQPRGTDVGRIIAYHAATRPHWPAIGDGDERIDFGAVNRRVNRFANALIDAGIRRGDRVAVRIPNSHRSFESLFACAKLAAIMVPISFAASPDDAQTIIRDCSAAIVIEGNDAFDLFAAGASESEPGPTARANDPLLIMYTSGTTGDPKGVVLTHNNVIYSSLNQMIGWQLGAGDRVLVVAPCHHVGGLLALGLPCLHTGGSVYFAPPRPGEILAAIERNKITALFLPPALWGQLAHAEAFNHADLASVRLCASGGDPVPTRILKHLADRFHAEFTDAYGLTEASSCATLLHGDDIIRRAGSAGKSLVHNIVRVVDGEGNPAAPGAIGEIVLEGPTVMKEYWRRPKETAVAIRDGWLWTGDRGYVDDEGFLWILGRGIDAITSNGSEVFPAEVERILRDYSAVADVAVTAVSDGDTGQAVAAIVVPRPGVTIKEDEIINFCAGKIAEYKSPKRVFVRDSLPRNANGKLARGKLRDFLAQSASS